MTTGSVFSLRASLASILVLPLLLLSGCWRDGGPTRPTGYLELLAHSNIPIVTSSKAATLTLSAHNFSDERIQWGVGNSSCQLDVFVTYEGEEHALLVTRGCTDDVSPQALDPGEARAEHMTWNGEVDGTPVPFRLPPGTYELWPAAGTLRGEKPLHIEVRD